MFNFNVNLRAFLKPRAVESEASQFGRDARRDWQAVFIVFLLLNLVSVALNLFVYERINKGELFLVDKQEAVTLGTLSRFDLEQTVSFFEEKRRKFESLKDTPLSLPDPGQAITPKN